MTQTSDHIETQPQPNPEKKENILVNILLNIVIPTVIMTKFSGADDLGPKWAIVVALAFPILYGISDFRRSSKVNLFSAIGVISIFLTGGISLLELDAKYIAIKEASIPGILGLATLISINSRYPLVKIFLYNDKILQIEKVNNALKHFDNETAFQSALNTASYLVAASFFLSSALNYGLAKYLLVSPPGSEAYTQELGKMTALSFPVIAVPATVVMMVALFHLFSSIKKLTYLELEDILVNQ
jgi:intracellular septation protein A